MRVRVMVWNVHGFRAGTKAMADAVRADEPDIVMLNETGYFGFSLKRFARRLDMIGSSGATLRWRIPNAVIARAPWRVLQGQVVVLPRNGRTLRRGAVLTQLGRSGLRLWLVAVHLGLSPQERMTHVRVLTDLLAGRDPLIIAGDLNEDSFSPASHWLGERYWDIAAEANVPTFPSKEPRARIDYLFTSEGIGVERVWTGDERYVRLSDHRPVFADVTLGEA